MLVGNGLLATAFQAFATNNDVVVFASGVSNSKENSEREFLREKLLLLDYLNKFGKTKKIIYFSTCSIMDTYFDFSDYTKHKMEMEQIIVVNAKNYNIFRLPQVLGLNNKHQLVGFLYDSIRNKKPFELFNIERNIIDIDDVSFLVRYLIKKNKFKNMIQNIANPKNIKVTDLVHILEDICVQKASFNIIDIEGSLEINIENIIPIIRKYQLFESNYAEKRIKKYYE